MIWRSIFFAIILNSLTFSLSYAQNQAKVYRIDQSIMRIKIIGKRGQVRLVGHPGNSGWVKISHTGHSSDWNETVNRVGDTFVVEIQGPADKATWTNSQKDKWPVFIIDGQAGAIPLEVYWHTGSVSVTNWKSSVAVTSVLAKVQVNGGEGDTRVNLRQGKVAIENRQGRVNVDAYAGDLGIQSVAGDLNIENFSGTTLASKINGHIQLHSSSGHVDIANSNGSVEFTVDKANVKLDHFSGAIRGETNQGLVVAQLKEPVDIRIKSRDGKVLLSAPGDSGANVNIVSKEGNIVVPNSIDVKRLEEAKTAEGDLPGSVRGFIFVRTETGAVRLK